MWKLNNILLSVYGIIPGIINGEGIAVKGIFDLPKRIGTTYKDWDDENSVQPYVDADEIFLEGRTILFNGVLTGSKAETEANIESLKTAIGNFNDVVPFETPYGSYCVYIEKITSKIHNGIATIDIDFREPEVGANCSIGGTVTTYLSEVRSGIATKNDCAVGYYGSPITLYSAAGQFTSNISVSAANELADAWILENKQNYANSPITGGFCTINPPIYYNEEQTGVLYRNNCDPTYSGSAVAYVIPAEQSEYNSFISVEDANSKAVSALNLVLTQEYANENGTCSILVEFIKTGDYSTPFSFGGGLHTQTFKIGEHMLVGTRYNILIYGKVFSVTSVLGDTAESLVTALVALINSETDWNSLNLLPAGESNPTATIYMPGYFTLWISYYSSATIWIGEFPPYWNAMA